MSRLKRSASNIIVSEFAVEHDKSIVVLRGKYDTLHPGTFRDVHPGILRRSCSG